MKAVKGSLRSVEESLGRLEAVNNFLIAAKGYVREHKWKLAEKRIKSARATFSEIARRVVSVEKGKDIKNSIKRARKALRKRRKEEVVKRLDDAISDTRVL